MKVAVLRFPGSNCDQDAFHGLRDDLGIDAEYVWHEDRSLAGFDAVFVPGGFSYGDYLRCGAMASHSPIMEAVRAFAAAGGPVIGACNGFQILCEAGLLPGALLLNESQKFVCETVHLRAVNRTSLWTAGVDRVVRIPIAHGEGRYIADDDTLKAIFDRDQVAFLYVDESGEATESANPNGSVGNVAGVLNEAGNVLGLMPHPERATRAALGSADGRLILEGLRKLRASV
ncbi:MAG: phosphoribosylformylglycinamidine synthase I [Fimbriimonadaceae bacterium]